MLMDGGEEKLVIFGWHTEVLNIWQQRFAKYGVVRIDGTTSATARASRIKEFLTNPEIRIIIGNILSLGTGTDGLQTVCNHVILGEIDWTPGNNQQAVDRLDRGGQRNQVQCDIAVVKGSFAERIMATALRKIKVIDKTLDARP